MYAISINRVYVLAFYLIVLCICSITLHTYMNIIEVLHMHICCKFITCKYIQLNNRCIIIDIHISVNIAICLFNISIIVYFHKIRIYYIGYTLGTMISFLIIFIIHNYILLTHAFTNKAIYNYSKFFIYFKYQLGSTYISSKFCKREEFAM